MVYTIQQISEMTGLSVHTLRYYEKIGLLNDVSRNDSGYRQYNKADLSWINFLVRLRATGMPIRDMKLYSDLRNEGEATIVMRRKLLENHQQYVLHQIKELKSNFYNIEEKIEYYKNLEARKRNKF